MARPIWKGSISFGLVNVPVVLYSAERRNELSFKLLDGRDHARVRYQRVNEVTGEEVPWDEIVKGYEYDDGSYVLITDEALEKAAIEGDKTIAIQDFVEVDKVGIEYYDKPYYLVPGARGEKGYVLLRETLARSGKLGIAKVVIRTRQYLSALIARDDALVLILLRFADEIRPLGEFEFPTGEAKEYKIDKREIDMAVRLVDSMTTDWKPESYHDEYREALLAWIEKHAEGGDVEEAQEPAEERVDEGEPVTDFMTLLKESVAKRGSGTKSAAAAAKKKTATKKSAKKKTAGRKTAAKKTAAAAKKSKRKT